MDENAYSGRWIARLRGKIVAQGSPAEVKAQLTETYLLIDAVNRDLLRQELGSLKIEFEEGSISEGDYYARFFCDGRPVDVERLHDHLRGAFHWLDGMEAVVAEATFGEAWFRKW